MNIRILAALLWLPAVAGPGWAQKTYSGSEAAALRCANTLALTAIALSDTGRMGEAEKDVMLGITVLILERHVTGTWAQKKAALAVVRDRRDTLETLRDFERYAETCLAQFPIN
ncbi:hypothetical protein [uncultured Roseobacter sp.]|uniref:hypothetical protein n=1 Tax=uncultured Roseobacter sp. TaxID=114847 RepID=UPI00260561B5|nr:hypothetical protein [uncultured Roseobacter sp.]